MTALEEIKKALKKVYIAEWYISGVKTNGLSVVHNAADGGMFGITAETFEAEYLVATNPAAISELLSTLESLQRENERLERERAKQWRRARRADASRDTYNALAKTFEAEANQMRDVSIANRHRAEAAEAEVKLIREAVCDLLDQAEHVCLGAHAPANIKEAAINLANPIKNVRTALASTGGEHHGN